MYKPIHYGFIDPELVCSNEDFTKSIGLPPQRAKSDSKDSKNSESSKGNSDKEDAKKDATPAGDSLTKKLADLGRVPLPPQTGK